MTCPVCQQEHADGGPCPPPADLAATGADPLVGKPLGDYGLVGATIFERTGDELLVDTFLMSCRALGRGVEDALLVAVFEAARAAGCATVVAPFREGPRNQQTKEFFLKKGFADAHGTLSMPVSQAPLAPKHLRLSLAIDDRLVEMPDAG